MTRRLAERRAVVTGSGRGIGRAIALAYAREGARLALFARTAAQIEETAAMIQANGGQALTVAGDVSSDPDVDRLRKVVVAEFGGVDILVNNAGIYVAGRFLDYSMDDWGRSLDVNLLGTIRMTRALLPLMLEAGSGRIINMASTAGKWGSLYQSAYNVTKHGVMGLTRCLALETASAGVRVNAICPGFVETDLVDSAKYGVLHHVPEAAVATVMAARAPIGRMVTPHEVAELAVYMASPEADAMTGVGITLAGGTILI